MDETPLYFDMPGSHMVHKKGKSKVGIQSTWAEKHRLRIILVCTAAGDMLPPMIIFKGKRALKNLRIPPGIVVLVQPKGWNDSTCTKEWIQKVLCRYTQKKHALLEWDTFSGHITNEIAKELRKKNVTAALIACGCTSNFQPIDVCLNIPLKVNCRNQWAEFMKQQVAQQDPGEHIKPASKQQVVNWVVEANKLLNSKKDVIRNSFLVQ